MGSPLRQEIQLISLSPPSSPETELVYKRDEQPRSTHDWCLYGFPWLVTMLCAAGWGYAIVGVSLNFQGARMTIQGVARIHESTPTSLLDQFRIADLGR